MLKAPPWCENAIPTPEGWTDPDTGEVYVSTNFTAEQMNTWNSKGKPAPAPEPVVEMLTEAPASQSLSSMSKIELEALGRQHGIELDRRSSKPALISRLNEVI